MKIQSVIGLAGVLGLNAACQPAAAQQQTAPVQERTAEVRARARAIAALEPAELAVPERTVDVLHYAIRLAVDVPGRRIEGSIEVRFRPFEVPRRRIQLDAEELTIRGVGDGSGREFEYEYAGDDLWIDLGEEVDPRSERQVVIEYQARPRKGLLFHVPDAECPDLPLQAWTQGQCEMNRAWFPCRDFPDERATSELFVTVDENLETISNGVLVTSTPTEDGRRTDHWRMEEPFPAYLTTLVVGDLAEVDLGAVGDVPLLGYADPAQADLVRPTLKSTGQVLELLEELIGLPYPWPGYRQVCVAEFPYGGMENVTATTLRAERLFPREREEEERLAIDSLIAHELAHQWWGDLVTCATWADVWLSEGFASYYDLLVMERMHGTEDFLATWIDVRESALDNLSDSGRPVVGARCFEPDELFDAHVYEGGSTFLHLLRSILGDEEFLRVCGAWARHARGRSVTTAELERFFQEATEADLAPLFQEWLHRPGRPELHCSWQWDEGDRTLELSVQQTQSGRDVPAVYHVPLAVAWEDEARRHTARMQLDERRTRLEVECPEEPRFVRFDDGGWLTARIVVAQDPWQWCTQLLEDDDPLGRHQAAVTLEAIAALLPEETDEADQPSRHLVTAVLTRALLEDSFVPARRRAAVALAGIGGTAARDALAVALLDDDHRVRTAAAEGLGELETDAAVLGLIARHFATERSDTVRAALLRSMAEHGGETIRAGLLEIHDDGDESWTVRGAALIAAAGMRGIDRSEVLARARADALRSAPREGRPAAIEALAILAPSHPEAVDALAALLEDPLVRIRSLAIHALAEAPSRRALPALAAAHGREPFPDLRVEIQRVIAELVPVR